MNVNDAKTILITDLAEKLGARFDRRTKPHVTVWYSPFRNEKTPSFHINERTNRFKDHGHHRPMGDTIDLWLDYHDLPRNDPEATKQALKALEAFDTIPRITPYQQTSAEVTYSDVYKIKKHSARFTDRACLDELERRSLSKTTIGKYLKQADVEVNKKIFRAISFENDKGGHEISTYGQWGGKPFKNCVGPKAITTFPAHPAQTEITAFVFNGKFDLATWDEINHGQKPNEEFICSNGDSLLGEVGAYLLSKKDVIKLVVLFPDIDPSGAGEKAMHALGSILEAEDIPFGFNEDYLGFKDLSAYYMRDKGYQSSQGTSNQPKNTLKPRF
ncbi:hypothetical protein [Dyadobacter psychrotolerans]|uniref:Toprim domain-containing protein n=1 Tax=Dyadobacter psychrotolerans TaxID=2541721 RepID=A0A4R5DYW9_9BACT|nr:hypothetical protein [Dyadobacter psychrotolerans]TDE17740.1 hypothetical protein E0F88_07565 [Dyadobacter psychrotolerans]